jgi:aryl-alcohol dehydrogenase-like predicted oxidoreductase
MWGGTDEAESLRAIRTAIDRGVNLIDTSPAYGFGLSEQLVGKAVAGRRSAVVIASKCGLVWNTQRGEFFMAGHGGRRINRHLGGLSIRREIEGSLTRLGTDYIDLYQTNWQDPHTPVDETMETLLDLRKEGKIRAIGVCNIGDVSTLERYRACGAISADQEQYSMLDRYPEEELIPYCRRHRIGFIAYSPLARGLLTGKLLPERVFKNGDHRRDRPRFSTENRQAVQEMLTELEPIAHDYGCTLAQLAVAWTVRQPGVTHTLVGTRNRRQAEEDLDAAELALSRRAVSLVSAVVDQHALAIQ